MIHRFSVHEAVPQTTRVTMSDIDSKIRELLHNIAKQHNYQNHKLKLTPISSHGASFTTFLYTATIAGDNKDDLNLFVKFAAMGVKIREETTLNIYRIEQFVYSELKKTYRELEDKHDIPKTKQFYFPEYYGANTTPLEETLVLENLAAKGFVSHDRFKSIDWQYASTAVTELAKFHALSMAYHRDYPEKFQQFSEVYTSDWINEQSVNTIWKPSFETSVAAVREENKAKLKKFLDSIGLVALKNFYKPVRCEVLAHIDFRPSNLMHRTRDVRSFHPYYHTNHINAKVTLPVRMPVTFTRLNCWDDYDKFWYVA